MLRPKGSWESVWRSNLHICVKTVEIRTSLIRSVLSTFIFGLIFQYRPLPPVFISSRLGKTGETGNQYAVWNDDFMRNTQFSSSTHEKKGCSIILNPASFLFHKIYHIFLCALCLSFPTLASVWPIMYSTISTKKDRKKPQKTIACCWRPLGGGRRWKRTRMKGLRHDWNQLRMTTGRLRRWQ